MKKVKILFTVMAVVGAASGAWATRNCQLCTGQQQYYKEEGQYFQAGVINEDYTCNLELPQTTCTYTKSMSGTYTSCRFGTYGAL